MRKIRGIICTILAAMMIAFIPASVFASEVEYDSSDAVCFVFSDDGIVTEDTEHSSNYKISDTDLSIKSSGTYILSGSCVDGTVTVKKGVTDVILVLNGLDLTTAGSETSATAPLTCNKSSGVTIVVAEGTENTLTDSIYNNDDTYTSNEDAENAVIKCKDGAQVTITGEGTLNIVSNGKNGIKSGTTDSETDAENPRDASLTIENVTLNITTAVNDGINAEQNLTILSGTLNIAAADDAIHSDYDLIIGAQGTAGPTIQITEAYEGLEGANISILSGKISILCTDDCINAANSDLTDYSFSLDISGGTIYAYTTTGDGFDSNGTLTISGGNVEVWSANTADNQPLDADRTITISGGTVFAAGGSNGMGSKLNATQTYITFGNSNNMGGGRGQMIGQIINNLFNPQGQQGNPDQPGGQQPGQPGGSDTPDGQNVSIQTGDIVNVVDSNENILYTTTAPCNTSYVLFSSGNLDSNSTYTITIGDLTPDTTVNVSDIFTDIEDTNWYHDAVQYVYDQGIMTGTNSTTFSPKSTLTRAQFAVILWRMSGSPAQVYNTKFSDVPEGKWYTDAVLWANSVGVVTGYGTSGLFGPSDTCTREQMVLMMYRYAKFCGYDTSTSASYISFTDASQVSNYAKEAMQWAVGMGIITGKNNGTVLDPKGNISRAECATIIMRFMDIYA